MKSQRTLNLLIMMVLVLGTLLAPAATMAQEPATGPAPVQPDKEGELEQESRQAVDLAYSAPLATWPGPDGFGYIGGTCTYNWYDISGTGTPVYLSDDSHDGPFPIGFTFGFYGNAYTDFSVVQ